MFRKTIIMFALVGLLPGLANADFDLKVYRMLQNVQDPVAQGRLSYYVTGLGRGVFWANVALESQGKKLLFCLPREQKTNDDFIRDLLDQEIKKPSDGTPYGADTPIEAIMVKAFMERYPCK